MRKPYPSDMTDEQWAIIEPLIPVNAVGRPRTNDMREVLSAISHLNRSGCQRDMLPHDLPAKSTVYNRFTQWRDDGTWQRIMDALWQQVRAADGREHRQLDGQGGRGERRTGLRRGQEAVRREAPYRG